MNGRPDLGPVVAVSIIALLAGQVAIAQVDWTYQDLAVSPGPPGSWDSGRHLVGDVVFDGTTYHMYLLGGETTVPWNSPWSIGHWTSTSLDGPWLEDLNNPVLEPEPGQWDGTTIYSAAVLYDPDAMMFRMWYGATNGSLGQGTAGYAESPDGSFWTKYAANPLAGLEPGTPGTWNDGKIFPGTVIKDGASYHMWFVAFEYNGGANDLWRVGHATSSDGLTWSQSPDPVLVATKPWEGTRVYNIEVVRIGDAYGMWYTGLTAVPTLAYVGYAVSPDGTHWGKWPDNPVISPLPSCNGFDSIAVIRVGDTFHGWGTNCYDVWHLTSPFEVLFFDDFESGGTSVWSPVLP
ncbi:MAG TPA: hypothetical protein VLT32_17620 [Candidatus Sulfomarinibacteraceae bacterium]|nr:hypothetical protein [Candidatus Sulfomarinibacteraceae bacterium]